LRTGNSVPPGQRKVWCKSGEMARDAPCEGDPVCRNRMFRVTLRGLSGNFCVNPNASILTRIVIRRNQSLSWRGLLRFLAWGSIPTLAFSGYAVYAGWWPIVGFCVGAFLLCAGLLYEVMVSAR